MMKQRKGLTTHRLSELKKTTVGPVAVVFSSSCSSAKLIYYIPINDTTFELPVFWPSNIESRINELRFSDSISLSFKTRLTSVTCLAATLCQVNLKHGTRERKHDDVTSRNVT